MSRRLEFQSAPHLITYTVVDDDGMATTTLQPGPPGEFDRPFPVRLDPAELTCRRGPGETPTGVIQLGRPRVCRNTAYRRTRYTSGYTLYRCTLEV